jgi:hypothetical protein
MILCGVKNANMITLKEWRIRGVRVRRSTITVFQSNLKMVCQNDGNESISVTFKEFRSSL